MDYIEAVSKAQLFVFFVFLFNSKLYDEKVIKSLDKYFLKYKVISSVNKMTNQLTQEELVLSIGEQITLRSDLTVDNLIKTLLPVSPTNDQV